jgi:hypothetical protein
MKLGEAWKALDDNTRHKFKLRADEAKAKFMEKHGDDAFLSSKSKKTKKIGSNHPGSSVAELKSSTNNEENKKGRSEAVAAVGMESSAKTSRKKNRQTSDSDGASASKAKEEKNASNGAVSANNHAAVVSIMEKAKALAAETATKKGGEVFSEIASLENSATSKKLEKNTTFTAKHEAAAVVETSKGKISPRKTMERWGEGDAPSAKRAKHPNNFHRVVVHHPNKVVVEISTCVEGTVLSWAQLARHFVEKSLLHPPQLFHLLSSLSPCHQTRYLFRYGDGYATVIDAVWAGKSSFKGDEGGGEVPIEANISLKPRDSVGDVMAVAWQRWTSAMEHTTTNRGSGESSNVSKDEDGVVHVDFVVEKVGLAEDQKAFGGGGGRGGGGGGETTSGDGNFRYTMTQLPYPIDDTRMNILYVKEHSHFSRVVDKFHVERLVSNTATYDNVKEGWESLLARSYNNKAEAAFSDASDKTKASMADAAFNNAARKIQASKASLAGGSKNSAAEKTMASKGEDAPMDRTKSNKGSTSFSKKNKTNTLATNDDIVSAGDSGKEVKMLSLHGSNDCPPTGGANASSDSYTQPANGLPDGWTTRVVPRKTNDPKTKSDQYWFSPKHSYKFNSKRRVDRFCECLEQAGGDEAAAYDLYSMAKTRKSGDAVVEGESSANAEENKKRKIDAVAAIGMDGSAKTSRKKNRLTSGADVVNASKAEKNASNAVVAANDRVAVANIMEQAKALAAAEAAASKKVNEVYNGEVSPKNAVIFKKQKENTTSLADSSRLPTPDDGVVVETSKEKISPRKTMKRLENVVIEQEDKGGDAPSAMIGKDAKIGVGNEHNDVPAVTQEQTVMPKPPESPQMQEYVDMENSSKSTSKKKKRKKTKSKTT